MVIEVYGPYGETPKEAVPFQKLVLGDTQSVIEVIFHTDQTGKSVYGIEFVVADDRNANTTKHLMGYTSKNYHEFSITFDSDEYLTQIYGTYYVQHSDNHKYVVSIGICTNLRRYDQFGYFGVPGSTPMPGYTCVGFETPPLADDDSIVEIFSSGKSMWLPNIGVRIRKGYKVERRTRRNVTKEKKEAKVEEKKENNKEEKEAEKIEVIVEEKKGSLAFFATYRPPVPLDIYSAKYPPMSPKDEELMTDGKFYNYNGQAIPPVALKTILQRPC